MSSPSTAKVGASSSRVVRNTKRDVNASRSRAFGASSISNSSRKVNGTGQSGSNQSTRVYLDGADVTPQSLLLSRIKPSTAQEQQQRAGNKGKGGTTRRSKNAHGGSSVIGASVILSTTSMSSLDDSSDTDMPSGSSTAAAGNKSSGTAAKAPSTAAAGGAKVSASTPATPVPVPSPGASNTSNQNGDEDAVGPESDEPGAPSEAKQQATAAASTQIAATDKESSLVASATSTSSSAAQGKPEKTRRRPVTIQLVETPTMVVFELRSVCVSAESSSHSAVAARNRQYLEMCAAKKGSDKFVEGRSQTLQLAQKGKEVMTAPPATRDVMCVATDWDIFDWCVASPPP